MKKNFKYMLVALLAVFGFSAAMAVISANDGQNEIAVDYYKYKITKMPTATVSYGTVTLVGLTDEAMAEANYSDMHITNGVLAFPETVNYTEGGKTYTFRVTNMESDAFKNVCLNAKSVTIPQYLEEIPTAAFNTLTRLTTLTFATGSQLKTIGNQAFASTNISNFDFTPCTKLAELPDEVFVEEWAGEGSNPNTNSVITTITLPTGSNFKHINGALRNLTSLATINLKDTWVREIVDEAFSGCAFEELELPGKDLLYISANAFKGCKKLATLTINADKLIEIGGGRVVLNENAISIADKYRWAPATEPDIVEVEDGDDQEVDYTGADTNLYGFSAADKAATPSKVAPLVTLNLKNSEGKTFEGKINTNAFAWCDKMDGLDLTQLNFGTESQIKTHAFFDCDGIDELTIGDIKDNQLGNNQFTIDANAFDDCPIATLTLGDILTANAIGSAAFGKSLETVTIGTVDAGDAAFAGATEAEGDNPALPGAFVFANKTNTTLNLAWSESELGYLSSQTPATKTIIPAGAFDFSAVTGLDKDNKPIANFVFPVLNIGELKSQGGIFAEGAMIGKFIEVVNFKGNINTNGLNTRFIALASDPIEAEDAEYEMDTQDKVYEELPEGGELGTEAGKFVETVDGFKKIETAAVDAVDEVSIAVTEDEMEALIGAGMAGEDDFEEEAGGDYKLIVVAGSEAVEATYEQEESDNKKVYMELPEGIEEGDPDYPAADQEGYYHITKQAVEAGYTPTNTLKSVTFEGAIKTKGITNGTVDDLAKGPFCEFPNLLTVTFNGMLSENAVDANTFVNSIKTADKKHLVSYTVETVEDPSVNPFNSDAFADAETGKGEKRVILWSVADETLAGLINHAILQNEEIDDEDAEVVDIMYNVFKWKPVKDDVKKDGSFFVIYQDYKTSLTHSNPNPTVAWGRYDLGSFEKEFKNPDYDPNAELVTDAEPTYEDGSDEPIYPDDAEWYNPTAYQATDMLIDRQQKIKQADGTDLTYMLTLYGVYNDEDPIAKKSTVYMVPLRVFNGQYAIPEDNTHLIIAKATTVKGTMTDHDVKVYYDTDIEGKNSVWEQLQDATDVAEADADDYSVFKKAEDTWTNQELNNAITRYLGDDAPDVDGAEIWIMSDPSKYRGFRVDRNEFVASTPTSDGAFIAEGWYFALLKDYKDAAGARVIWLGEDEATGIFGVKNINAKDAVNGKSGDIYNLQGIRVNKPAKGLYIQDGKKFVVK